MRYVALGDSYTIGTNVGEGERWPNQLVAAVHDRVPLELVANLGVNGYSSGDLIRVELPLLAGLEPDLVTMLIRPMMLRGVPLTDGGTHRSSRSSARSWTRCRPTAWWWFRRPTTP